MATFVAKMVIGRFCGSTATKIAGGFIAPLIPNPISIIVFLVILFSVRFTTNKLNGNKTWKKSALNTLWIYYLIMVVICLALVFSVCTAQQYIP